MNRISKARQARIDAGEEKLNYGSTIGTRTGERKKKPTLDELKKNGVVKKANTLTARNSKKAGVKELGQADVFKEIWDSRKHECEVCGRTIREPKASNFSHILGKGAYPSMKLVRRNIRIWCCDLDLTIRQRDAGQRGCHDLWTWGDFDGGDEKWQHVLALEESLIIEAKKLGHK